MELVDILDLKSRDCNGRGGSSPPTRTKIFSRRNVFCQKLMKISMTRFACLSRLGSENITNLMNVVKKCGFDSVIIQSDFWTSIWQRFT